MELCQTIYIPPSTKEIQLHISAPGGDFMLTPTRKPIVLLSGGVGITPMMSMFNYLVEKGSTCSCYIYTRRNQWKRPCI